MSILELINNLNIDKDLTATDGITETQPKAFSTINDFTTADLKLGTVYSVVKSVVVKSTFLFIKLLAITVKRS